LTGARAFNRVSGPDANSCAGCHNAPHALPGGGGDYATQAFIGAAFGDIGCGTCHIPSLPLDRKGWVFSEPGPFNPRGNLQRTGARLREIDLTNPALPQPRLQPNPGDLTLLDVPAYTDFKLHDMTDPTDQAYVEPLDINQPAGSPKSWPATGGS
jgi:hypothetical protein